MASRVYYSNIPSASLQEKVLNNNPLRPGEQLIASWDSSHKEPWSTGTLLTSRSVISWEPGSYTTVELSEVTGIKWRYDEYSLNEWVKFIQADEEKSVRITRGDNFLATVLEALLKTASDLVPEDEKAVRERLESLREQVVPTPADVPQAGGVQPIAEIGQVDQVVAEPFSTGALIGSFVGVFVVALAFATLWLKISLAGGLIWAIVMAVAFPLLLRYGIIGYIVFYIASIFVTGTFWGVYPSALGFFIFVALAFLVSLGGEKLGKSL